MRSAFLFLVLACGGGAEPANIPTLPTPSASAAVKEVPMDDDARVRAFLKKATSGDYDGATARCDETMRGALANGKLAEIWKSLVLQVGAFKSIDKIAFAPKDALKIAQVQATFEKAALTLRVVLQADGSVTGFFIIPNEQALKWEPPPYAK